MSKKIVNNKIYFLLFLTTILLATNLIAQDTKISSDGVNWPSFRGMNASGIAENYSTPTTWNVEKSENIKWKVPVEGLGHSSPIIWGDKIYVTTTISGKDNPQLKVGLYGNIASVEDETIHKWKIYAINKNSGEIVWQNLGYEGVPRVKRHTKATHSNSTPATDGRYIVTFFGSEGLFCYTMDGKQLWHKDLGLLDSGYYKSPKAQWGFASSPVIYKDRVIVQCDVQKNSFIAAFDIKTGDELWRTGRDEVPTWGTPTIHISPQRSQVIVNGYKHIGGYDLNSGKELWKLVGGGDIPIPTPVIAHDLIFITNAHGRAAPMYAIRLNASGDISLNDDASSNDYIAWSVQRNGAYMQTPLVYGNYIYSSRNNGVLKCYNAKTGEMIYQERIGSGKTGFSASPVAANGKLYFTSEYGDIYVLQAGPEFKVLAINPMDEICMATPAISAGVLYFRTQNHLVAVGE